MRDALYSPLNMRLSKLMKRARVDAGITQRQLAEATNRTQAYISKFERGQLRLDVADFLAFSKSLGIDPHQLLDALIKEADAVS